MLQRPQTIYLLLVFILSILLLTGPLAVISLEGAVYILEHSGLTAPDGIRMELATWPMSALFVAAAALSFLNIFSYKNSLLKV